MRAYLTLLVLFSIISTASGQRRYHLPNGISEEQINPQWVVVKVKNATEGIQSISNEIQLFHKTQSGSESILDRMCKIKVGPNQDPVELINLLLKNPNVEYAEPILRYDLLYSPDDPNNTTSQSYLEQISAYDAWDVTRGDDDITIGIIDTGVDLDHDDLVTSLWINEADPVDGIDNDGNGYVDDYNGYDFADGDNDANSDGNPHGARVAGVAGASTDNSIGMSGVGFNTKIAALKGFTTSGSLSVNLFEAIVYGADMGMDVLNLSWGSVREPLQSEQDILNYAVLEKNVAITVAAGNDGAKANPEALFYPASYDNVLSVGATDSDDIRWDGSTYNWFVDLVAPGVSIFSTVNDSGYGTQSGTSFAAPIVAGVAALVKAEFPSLTAQQIMERVRVSADDIYDVGTNSSYEGKLGRGRVNAFNAVSLTNLKSIRISDFSVSTSHSNQLFFGDTVTIDADFTNFLNPISNPQITISSPEGDFTVAETTFQLSGMNTLETDSAEFQIILNENLAPETPIVIRLDFMDGTYSDFEFIQTTTSPDRFDFGSNLKMTVAGNGNVAFAGASYVDGVGVEFNGNTILDFAGLMLATSTSDVSNNFIADYSNGSKDQDFNSLTNFKLHHHPAADIFGYSEFEDAAKNIVIEQSTYTWTDEDYILLRYRIINNSAFAINDLSVGFFSDFDLDDAFTNRAAFDIPGDYIYTNNLSSDLYSGTKVIANGTAGYSALDVSNQNGNAFDIENTFSDADKFDFLKNQLLASAGDFGDGNDVAMLNGTTITQIDPFDSEYVNVIISVSTSKSNLETEFASAETRLSEVIANPRILEQVFSCEGSQVTIDPASGTTFEFFEDPEGLMSLHSGSSFTTGIINQDTSFYVRNMDGAYSSDIFQIPVSLIDEVANFSMQPDTLYLDNITNVVSFNDQSFEANLWNWDFGQGTTSTLQNPSLSFSQAGVYPVSLYVENDAGCTDTTIKSLVVAERPDAPDLGPFNICPGDMITLSDPTADFLEHYENENDVLPILSGNDLELGPFFENTTIYVSGTYSQFESRIIPVDVNVDQFPTDFKIEIDTNSFVHQIVATIPDGTTSFEWFVNNSSAGTSDQITVDSSLGDVTIRLDQSNTNGCMVSEEKSFAFSSSAIPSQQDVTFCQNENPLLQPQNGEIFGFYEDAELTTLIKKGSELLVTEDMKVFVVGLDDGLPSSPREVNITLESFDLSIESTTEKIGDKNKVSLSATPAAEITSYQWFVDGVLTEITSSPVLTFDNTIYLVVIQATNSNGCVHSDTITLDFSPPLGLTNDIDLSIFPNPTTGSINLSSASKIQLVQVLDIAGNFIFEIEEPNGSIKLNQLAKGIYLLKVKTQKGLQTKKLIIN